MIFVPSSFAGPLCGQLGHLLKWQTSSRVGFPGWRLGRNVLPRGGYAHGSYPIMRENRVRWVMEWVVEL